MTLLYSSAVRLTGSVARGPNPRIKSLSAASSLGFTGVRAAAQTGCAYSDERDRIGVNCNPCPCFGSSGLWRGSVASAQQLGDLH